MALLDNDTVQIANGGSLSGVLLLGDKTLCGFHFPPAFTGTSMSFQVSYDGGTTWSEFYDAKAGSATVTVAQGQYIALDPNMWRGVNAVKLRSGTAGSPTAEAGARSIVVMSRRVF